MIPTDYLLRGPPPRKSAPMDFDTGALELRKLLARFCGGGPTQQTIDRNPRKSSVRARTDDLRGFRGSAGVRTGIEFEIGAATR